MVRVNKKYGRLTVISTYINSQQRRQRKVICKCECGAVKEFYFSHVKRGKSKSCGCLARELNSARIKTHGLAGSSIYNIHQGMMARCYNVSAPGYKFYGARGIRVDNRWHKFENFFADMGHPPKGHSLERIDNNGKYSRDNCIWASPMDQANNTRRNINLTYNGTTQSVAKWSRQTGIKSATIYYRYHAGKPISDVLSLNNLKDQEKSICQL